MVLAMSAGVFIRIIVQKTIIDKDDAAQGKTNTQWSKVRWWHALLFAALAIFEFFRLLKAGANPN
jgi:hypothetical protein